MLSYFYKFFFEVQNDRNIWLFWNNYHNKFNRSNTEHIIDNHNYSSDQDEEEMNSRCKNESNNYLHNRRYSYFSLNTDKFQNVGNSNRNKGKIKHYH